MEIKTFALTNEKGNRNPKVCNGIRKQMVDKIIEILEASDFEVETAANGDVAIKTAIDINTGNAFYTRLAITFSDKELNSKVVAKKKVADPVEIPDLFAAEDESDDAEDESDDADIALAESLEYTNDGA